MTSDAKSSGAPNTAELMTYAVLPDRMPPIPPDEMSDAQRKAAAALIAGPRGVVKGPFLAMMRSPELLDRTQKLGEYLRYQSELDPRIKIVASLITNRHWTSQSEWGGHIRAAAQAGLKPSIVEAIAEGRRPTGMATDEEIVYDFTTELLTNKSVSDTTYGRAVSTFGEKNVMDLLGVAGYYSMLAMILNVARTKLSDDKNYDLDPMPQQLSRIK